VRILVVILVLTCAAVAWWYFAPDTLPAFARAYLPAAPNSAPTLYKWRDAKGHLNYTDKPPTDRPYDVVRYNPDANVLPKGVAPGK
jgi:hypothetical protein